jgi:hypothetical protein
MDAVLAEREQEGVIGGARIAFFTFFGMRGVSGIGGLDATSRLLFMYLTTVDDPGVQELIWANVVSVSFYCHKELYAREHLQWC